MDTAELTARINAALDDYPGNERVTPTEVDELYRFFKRRRHDLHGERLEVVVRRATDVRGFAAFVVMGIILEALEEEED